MQQLRRDLYDVEVQVETEDDRRRARALGAPTAAERLDPGPLLAQPAGEIAGQFLPAFVPFAEDMSGTELFVDTRPGPRSGCVGAWLREDGDSEGPRWSSVAVMLAEVADGLESGQPIGYWRPLVDAGRLFWDVV